MKWRMLTPCSHGAYNLAGEKGQVISKYVSSTVFALCSGMLEQSVLLNTLLKVDHGFIFQLGDPILFLGRTLALEGRRKTERSCTSNTSTQIKFLTRNDNVMLLDCH
jgi:hypothetical protein